MMEEDEEICRVCRSEGTPEQPLFHPCKCSGTIKHVHQDCLIEWLEHSNTKYCYLCKHNFSFTPVYSQEMPAVIPTSVLLYTAIDKMASGFRLFLRGLLVGTIWLILLPYFTIWIWRLYFWIGESFAYRANGLETPAWNTTAFFSSRHNFTLTSPTTSAVATVAASTTTAVTNSNITASGMHANNDALPMLLLRSLSPRHEWISKFFLDCFEGQIISAVVVFTFVAIFLMREWVVQNGDAEAGRERDRDQDRELVMAGALVDDLAAGQDEDVPDLIHALEAPMVEPEPPAFNMEQAMERLIAAQHQIQAVLDGEPDLEALDSATAAIAAAVEPSVPQQHYGSSLGSGSGSGVDIDASARPEMAGRNSQNHNFVPSAIGGRPLPITRRSGDDNYQSELQNNLGESSASLGSRTTDFRQPIAEDQNVHHESNSDDLRQRWGNVSYGDRDNALDQNPRLPLAFDAAAYRQSSPDISDTGAESSSSAHRATLTGREWTRPERSLALFDNAGEGSSSSPSSAAPSSSLPALASTSAPGAEGEPRTYIHSQSGTQLFAANGDLLTFENVYLREDGSRMTRREKTTRFSQLWMSNDLAPADVARLSPWTVTEDDETEFVRRPGMPAGNNRPRLFHDPPVEQPALPNHQLPHHRPHQHAAVAPVAPAPAPFAPVRIAFPPPPPIQAPPPLPQRPPAPVPAMGVDDMEDDGGPEFVGEDGILEVIGMYGSYWMLLQNALLMSALMCASLGVGVWIPFMIGKTVLLLSPMNVFRIPFRLFSWVTDPILDFVIDECLPVVASAGSYVANFFGSKISPVVSHVTDSYFGLTSVKYIDDLVQEYVMPTWQAVIVGTPTVVHLTANEGAAETISTLLEDGDLLANVTMAAGTNAQGQPPLNLLKSIGAAWNNVAYGNASGDKFLATFVGYSLMFAMAYWYLQKTHNTYGQTFGRAARDALRQQGLILKIAFFITLEMIVFPVLCGIALNLSTLPLFKGATVATRFAFYLHSPNWCIIMHWLSGTAFMYNISIFVQSCRDVVRPGVMWFIRDPNDPQFQPVRELLERSLLVQLRKLGTGLLMYLSLIFSGVGLTIYGTKLLFKGVFPLRWPIDAPISDFPIDLLLFHLVIPLTLRWINPAAQTQILFTVWWRKTARALRLSSFMYGKDGERYPDEEGRIVYKTWWAWLTRAKPFIRGEARDGDEEVLEDEPEPNLNLPRPHHNHHHHHHGHHQHAHQPEGGEGDDVIEEIQEEVVEQQPGEGDPAAAAGGNVAELRPLDVLRTFAQLRRQVRRRMNEEMRDAEAELNADAVLVDDGGLIRVPNIDNILILKGRRVLVPVGEDGNAINPADDLPGEVDPMMEGHAIRRGDARLIDPKDHTVIVYAPPFLMRRLMAFVALLWASAVTFVALSFLFPMMTGRVILASILDREVHDTYSFAIGLYFLGFLYHLGDFLSSQMNQIQTRGWEAIDIKVQAKFLVRCLWTVLKVVYFGVAFAIVMPFLLTLLVELYVILPLRKTAADDVPGIMFVMDWALGLVYMKMIHRFLNLMPNNPITRLLNRIFPEAGGIMAWNIGLATKQIILPILGLATLAIGAPSSIAWFVTKFVVTNLPDQIRATVFRLSYPILLVTGLTVYGVKEATVVIRTWSQYVRDEVYLVGRQLHNLPGEADGQGSAASAAAESVASTSDSATRQPTTPSITTNETNAGTAPSFEAQGSASFASSSSSSSSSSSLSSSSGSSSVTSTSTPSPADSSSSITLGGSSTRWTDTPAAAAAAAAERRAAARVSSPLKSSVFTVDRSRRGGNGEGEIEQEESFRFRKSAQWNAQLGLSSQKQGTRSLGEGQEFSDDSEDEEYQVEDEDSENNSEEEDEEGEEEEEDDEDEDEDEDEEGYSRHRPLQYGRKDYSGEEEIFEEEVLSGEDISLDQSGSSIARRTRSSRSFRT